MKPPRAGARALAIPLVVAAALVPAAAASSQGQAVRATVVDQVGFIPAGTDASGSTVDVTVTRELRGGRTVITVIPRY